MGVRQYITRPGAVVATSSVEPAGGAREVHLVVEPVEGLDLPVAMAAAGDAYRAALRELGLPAESAVFRRVFVPEAVAGAAAVAGDGAFGELADGGPVALSVVEQPPLPSGGPVLWAWHVHDRSGPPRKERGGAAVRLSRPGREHLWTTGLTAPAPTLVEAQTTEVFARCKRELGGFGGRLADHLLRTWVYVRDIDRDYGGMVRARRDLLARSGLTAATHFVASTGIQGRTASPDALYLKANRPLSPLAARLFSLMLNGMVSRRIRRFGHDPRAGSPCRG